jgi:hypothetical protein
MAGFGDVHGDCGHVAESRPRMLVLDEKTGALERRGTIGESSLDTVEGIERRSERLARANVIPAVFESHAGEAHEIAD